MDGGGVVERGGEPLDPGDVVGAAALDRGRRHHPENLLRAVAGPGRHPATQAQPAHLTRGAADPELQLPPGERGGGRLQDRHERVHVLREGVGDQAVRLAVELVGCEADQVEQCLVGFDHSGVRHQDEGADLQGAQREAEQ